MNNVRLIILSHYDFTNTSGEKIKGSKIALTSDGNNKLEMSTKCTEVESLELMKPYVCDLYINQNLKIDIKNVREK